MSGDQKPEQNEHGSLSMDPRLSSAWTRIENLEQELVEQAEARADLVHLVSHELRTPITVISGFSRLLESEQHGVLNDEQRRFVREGLRACRRLDEFVEDLIESRPDEKTPFAVILRPGDLHETIEGQLESLLPMLEGRGAKVVIELRAAISKTQFDDRRIEQVVNNLMTNAIRYGCASGVIRVGTIDTSIGNAPAIAVSVEDEGPGIPVEDRERLFAPFVRGTKVGISRGLGIGLAICRRIIEAHHGQIYVEDGAQGGARFVFVLPRTRCADGEE
jgi:signal transduction histidine kinase